MIASSGGRIACLGGPRGDRLYLSRDEGPFVPLLDLGWIEAEQCCPQRRLRLGGDEIWVLEPVEGALLRPPLRVRRIGPDGSERGSAVGGRSSGDADLSVLLLREVPGPLDIVLCGIAADRPEPLYSDQSLSVDLMNEHPAVSGVPLRRGADLWIPVREEGVFCVGVRGPRVYRGKASRVVQDVAGHAVCAGRGGAFVDGVWRRASHGPAFAPFRSPLSGIAAEAPDGGIVLLSPQGGVLGRCTGAGPPGRLPSGRYSALLRVGPRLYGVAEGDPPALVGVAFDSPP